MIKQEYRVIDDDELYEDIVLSTPRDEATSQRFIELNQSGSVIAVSVGMLPELIDALTSLKNSIVN